jgi:hypothetical protein
MGRRYRRSVQRAVVEWLMQPDPSGHDLPDLADLIDRPEWFQRAAGRGRRASDRHRCPQSNTCPPREDAETETGGPGWRWRRHPRLPPNLWKVRQRLALPQPPTQQRDWRFGPMSVHRGTNAAQPHRQSREQCSHMAPRGCSGSAQTRAAITSNYMSRRLAPEFGEAFPLARRD